MLCTVCLAISQLKENQHKRYPLNITVVQTHFEQRFSSAFSKHFFYRYKMKKTTVRVLNATFLLFCASILVLLLKAPEESTAKVPRDDDHIRFYSIASKKEAESYCSDCHGPGLANALPKDHPPSYRCLFCHKRI